MTAQATMCDKQRHKNQKDELSHFAGGACGNVEAARGSLISKGGGTKSEIRASECESVGLDVARLGNPNGLQLCSIP